jgi:hypothetical protein
MEIYLTRDEYKHALDVGFDRNLKHRLEDGTRKGTKYRTGRELPDIAGDMLGCVAEAAVAKAFNTKWNDEPWDLADHKERKKAPDVEPYFEVRRVNREDGRLSIRADDDPEKVAVLVWVDWQNSQRSVLLGAVKISEVLEKAVVVNKATSLDYFVYFPATDSYLVDQKGLVDALSYTPTNLEQETLSA